MASRAVALWRGVVGTDPMDSPFRFLFAYGHAEARVPPGFAIQADVEAVAGGQEALRRAGFSKTEILGLLEDLRPLRPKADHAEFDLTRSTVRHVLLDLDNEMRAVGGTRIEIVEAYLRDLLGERSTVVMLTPDVVGGQLAVLRDFVGVGEGVVATVEEERVRASFWKLTNLIADLRSSWDSHRSTFPDAASLSIAVQPYARQRDVADIDHRESYLRLSYGPADVTGHGGDDVEPGSATGEQNGSLGDCPVFPPDNAWNTNVSEFPVHPNSSNYIASILSSGVEHLRVDSSIPYVTVAGTQPAVPVTFGDPDQSDPGPYPIPPQVPIENSDDAHVIVIDRENCVLYELYNASRSDNGWVASNGARWDLASNAPRPIGWASADVAGLPIFAGLVRYDEVASGHIDHALRVVMDGTQKGFVLPATHCSPGGNTDPNSPPMGLRLRLRADYDLTSYSATSRVILEALKTYGLIVADTGQNWFLTAAADSRWSGSDWDQLRNVPGSAFEVVNTGPVRAE